MECDYCKKTYVNKSSLLHHQRTAKICLKLQEHHGILLNKITHQCDYCTKELTTKPRLEYHLSVCKFKKKDDQKRMEQNARKLYDEKEDQYEQLATDYRNEKEQFEYELRLKDDKIKELEDRLKNGSSAKTINNIKKNINNNHITINQIMTPESVREFFKNHYNLETLLGGQKSLAQFICDGFIREKDVYHCTDRSRHKFVLGDENGKHIEDTNCDQLIGLTAPGLPHIKDVYEDALFSTPEDVTEEEIQDNYRKISNIDKNRVEFTIEMSKIAPSLQDTKPTTQYEQAVEQLKKMRAEMIPYDKKSDAEEKTELLQIGGISLGQLEIYRQGYRDRKAMVGDNEDVPIKGPRALLERFKENPTIKQQYIDYITKV